MKWSLAFVAFSFVITSLALAEGPATKPAINPTPDAIPSTQPKGTDWFNFKLQRGQYFFIGQTELSETGTGEKAQRVETFVDQLWKGLITPDAKSDIWNLRISRRDAPEKGITRWQLLMNLTTNVGPNGSMFPCCGKTWFVDQMKVNDVMLESLQLEEIEISKAEKIPGLEFHKFIFAKANGKTQLLVVIIGDRGLFSKVVPRLTFFCRTGGRPKLSKTKSRLRPVLKNLFFRKKLRLLG